MADVGIIQHIDGGQGFGVHAAGLEQLNGSARKTAHGEIRIALHEQDDVVVFDQLVDTLLVAASAASAAERAASVASFAAAVASSAAAAAASTPGLMVATV